MIDKSKLKKAIIFDCDNTLWFGVIGEGNVIPDTNLQNQIVMLAKRGVIIGLCSKNNIEDVQQQLQQQPLTDEYISVKRVNWKDKVSNLKEIAEELNIGLDAIVFVDDSYFELNLVKRELPQVLSILPDQLTRVVMEWFDLSGDLLKTQQYKANYERAKVREQFTDIDDYLRSLEMKLNIKLNDRSQISRISELTQKTNQFNLTTHRYTEKQIEQFMKSNLVYSLSVRDKYGDSGLVGVCIVVGSCIDTFLLSCRVLGRNIEYAFLDQVIGFIRRYSSYALVGRYIESEKNKQVRDFYTDCGFQSICVNGEKILTLPISYSGIKISKNLTYFHFTYD